MSTALTAALREEYETLFARMRVNPERAGDVARLWQRIAEPSARASYMAVAAETRVAWFVVAIIHSLESTLRFDAHLHNGDPLTGRTVHVPAGRPQAWSLEWPMRQRWVKSAIDALRHDALDKIPAWDAANVAFALERYNGFGYRRNYPAVKSPYLWSFSDVYTRGKYRADGLFDPSLVSQQCGGMVLLKHMATADAAISARIGAVQAGAAAPPAAAFPALDGPEGAPVAPVTPPPPPFPRRYLLIGIEDDADVARVQRRLAVLGYPPGPIDGDFGALTDAALRRFQAQGAEPSGEPLEIDGVVGPLTWAALFGGSREPAAPVPVDRADGHLGRTALGLALAEEGVREDPLGSNRGPRVTAYIRSVLPSGPAVPWCMCFVYWCYGEAARRLGRLTSIPRTAGVQDCWRRCGDVIDGTIVRITQREALLDPSRVEPGMAFFIDTGGGTGHTGLVVSEHGGLLETIEGNTNDGGGREGIGVFRRSRRTILSINLGFAAFR